MDCLTGFFDFDVYFFSEYGSSKRELQLILNGISIESLWISKEDFGTSRMSRMVFKLCHNFLMISPLYPHRILIASLFWSVIIPMLVWFMPISAMAAMVKNGGIHLTCKKFPLRMDDHKTINHSKFLQRDLILPLLIQFYPCLIHLYPIIPYPLWLIKMDF